MQGLIRAGTAVRVAGWLLLAVLGVVWLAQPRWPAVGRLLAAPGWSWVPILITVVGVAGAGWQASHRWRRSGLFGHRPAAERVPLVAHVTALLVLAAGVAAGVGIGLWALLGRPSLTGTPGPGGTPAAWSVQNTFEAVKIALTMVAGIGGVVALTVAYRKQGHDEAAERRENTKLFNERFGKAAEQLGSDKAAVRLAGVYAMAGLADDWDTGRQTCIDVLCAYLRKPYTPPAGQAAPDTAPADDLAPAVPPPARRTIGSRHSSPRRRASAPITVPTPAHPATPASDPAVYRAAREEQQVRHTILDLIGTHLQPLCLDRGIEPRWHDHRFDLRGATLDGGDLKDIIIPVGTTLLLANAQFTGGTVSFDGAWFTGGTMSFTSAQFIGGDVSFTSAWFNGGNVYFDSAKFSAGTVSFGAARFVSGTVSFHAAEFTGGVVDLAWPQRWLRPPRGITEATTGVRWPSAEHLHDLDP
ncbi:hypothetical protein ACTOB_003619 [Actinoplanes oblitus]|uniref:Pentapeptide repeat-containing protein n=1 Tax=Actinoplanes oblitus TaxID=3040509 RepID=A0ABY8WPX1_9ACTN|nr:hypothetical protein [Actinoplanes oblitus]WIM99949.1 hypothetical protein ACTOB_003619 [Actinoplanes oblitus]